MATVTNIIKIPDTTGTTSIKIKYRLANDSIWTSYLATAPSANVATTYVISGLQNNRLYSLQLQNINGVDNPVSLITQGILITDPLPTISPTNNSVGFSFANLSPDITSYTIQLTTAADPGTILNSVILSPGAYPGTLSGSFAALLTSTFYNLIFIPVVNQFTNSFVYTFSTTTFSCAASTNVTATLTT